jgi:Mrp family chromosome partitioning ATPase
LIQIEQFPNLHVLPAGEHCKNPVELLDSAAWRSLCAKLRESYKFIIVDSPPIAAVADYDLIQAACDGVIVVVRPDHTERHLCFKALGSVPKDKLTGVVLNCVEQWFLGRGYHYGYSYHY